MQMIPHWIGGKPYHSDGERRGDVYNPATGEVAAQVPLAGAEEVDKAVHAAREAFQNWRSVSLTRRARIMFAYHQLLEEHNEDLVRLVTKEHGKVLDDARGEVARGREVVEYACGIPTLLKSEFNENVSSMVDSYGIRQPLGVCVGITPFNFPVMVPMWMYPLAIACGNAFVLKPSERDPSASILQAELLAEAGLPEGVLNVVHGDKQAVDALLVHPDVASVSFVGSTPIARYIYETSTNHDKRVQALGGAKNHALVLPDADLDFVADQITSAAYGSAGERCMAISTVVAVADAGDPLVDKLSDRAAALTVGDGFQPNCQMGPLVTKAHRDRVVGYVDAGVQEGATLVLDGRDLQVEGQEDGFFLGPCLFDYVTTDMSIYTDEIFGPVLIVVRVDTYDEGIDLINRNPYGNGTAIFTNDGGAARMFQHEVQAGMVGVNVPIPVPMAYHSFGGWKDSLFGDLHIHGPEGVRFYTRGKLLTTRWPDPHDRGVDLGFPVSQ